MITIKKYGNRRLYDTSRSTYINLEELTELVRNGEAVVVVDAKTGEDLTREILLQIILEVLRGGDFFPTGMLRRIIRATGDSPPQQLLRQQLTAGLELMSSQLDHFEALMPKTARPPRPKAATTEPEPEPEPARERETPPPPPPERAPTADSAAEDLDELRARLAALEQRLGRRS